MDNFEDYLSHHGIMGQKWGIRNALWYPIEAYQKSKTYLENLGRENAPKAAAAAKEGARKVGSAVSKGAAATKETAKKVKASHDEHAKAKKKKKQLANARKAKANKAAEAKRVQKEAEDFEAKKERILNNGTPGEVLKIADRLTNNELQYAITRNDSLTRLREAESRRVKSISDKESKKKWGTIKNLVSAYGSLGDAAGTVYKSTKNIWKLMNMNEESFKNDGKQQKSNKNKDKDD